MAKNRGRSEVPGSKKKTYYPKYPDPSKRAILRTLPLRHTGSNPSIGGSQLILTMGLFLG